MLTDLLILVPVGLALGLVAFGRYGDRGYPEPTPLRIALTALAAVLLGPVAVEALGLFVWLVGVAAVAAGITMIALLRTPPRHA
jgi:hypothetical protein